MSKHLLALGSLATQFFRHASPKQQIAIAAGTLGLIGVAAWDANATKQEVDINVYDSFIHHSRSCDDDGCDDSYDYYVRTDRGLLDNTWDFLAGKHIGKSTSLYWKLKDDHSYRLLINGRKLGCVDLWGWMDERCVMRENVLDIVKEYGPINHQWGGSGTSPEGHAYKFN